MIDMRPVGYVLGLLVATLGVLMLVPMAVDLIAGGDNWLAFFESALIAGLVGGLVALASVNGATGGLTLRQSFLLTTGVWVVMPLFGALPFILGEPGAGFSDAYFEAMSGVTTTGSTVFVGLDNMAPGVLLWRSILQWLGGLGIIIVALVFLPVMKVGGMQFFKSEAFDTLGKVLPRAFDISLALIQVYVVLTVLCAGAYVLAGMSGFDAVNHAMTTIATGGFSTRDSSFSEYSAAAQYAGTMFMVLSGLPFIRYVQLTGGSFRPLLQDIQVRAFLRWIGYSVGMVCAYRMVFAGENLMPAIRESAFNVISLFTGTGYGSADVEAWGSFPLVVFLVVGFIGACTASTGCSIKVFRYLVLFEAIKAEIRRLQSPNRVAPVRLEGRTVGDDVINAVIVLFTLFVVTFGLLAIALSLTGLDTRTAITAAWTAVCNVGPAFGAEVGPTGAMDGFPLTAKWLMIVGMLMGRLELLSVLVLFLPRFWRG